MTPLTRTIVMMPIALAVVYVGPYLWAWATRDPSVTITVR